MRQLIHQLNSDLQATSGEPVSDSYINALNNLKNIWNSIGAANFGNTTVTTARDNVGGALVIVAYYKHPNGNYGAGLFISYSYPRPMYVTLFNGVWNEPVLL